MSLDRIKGAVAFFCDCGGCETGIETGEREFTAAVQHARDAGWEFRRREGGEWKHYCCRGHEEYDFRGQSISKEGFHRG